MLEGLRYDTIEDVFRRGLHSYLTDVLANCRVIGEDIAHSYFYYGVGE